VRVAASERVSERVSTPWFSVSVISLSSVVVENKWLRRGKTDLDRRVWLFRIHDYRLGRLHIHALLVDLFDAVQGKFLGFFKVGSRPGTYQNKK
jgi:hypothetical protein